MLTGNLIKPRLRWQGDTLWVEMLDVQNREWLTAAERLIHLFREQVGKPRLEWELAYERFEGNSLGYIVLRGLAKVLEDSASFSPVDTRVDPEVVREHVFAQGPSYDQEDLFHRLSRTDLLVQVAADLGCNQAEVEQALFADLEDEKILVDPGPQWTPGGLLGRYNLELARGVLYWAREMQLEIHDSYKDVWHFIKLFKLMHEAHVLENGGYAITLDGPMSPFIRGSTRYGRQFAAFLPALFLCKKWRMRAQVQVPQTKEWLWYTLDERMPLVSHFRRSGEFDSVLEQGFAAEFAEKFGGERGKWRLAREDEVLLLGSTVMIPDFSVTHKVDGRRALIELVGFWHPDYLRRKVEKVLAAQRRDLILVVYEGVNLTPEHFRDAPGAVLFFKQKPILKDVMAAVEKVAQ